LDASVSLGGGAQQVLEGEHGRPVCLIPVSGPQMQRSDDIGLDAMKLAEQELSEECVVAVPLSPTIQRDEERVRGLELAQAILAASLFDEDVAQWGTQLIEHRGASQESLRALRELAQRLTVKVIGHETVITRNRRTVTMAGSGDHRGQVEASWPSFGPLRSNGSFLVRGADVCFSEDLLGRRDIQGQLARNLGRCGCSDRLAAAS
jgi:hypothetical protein